MKCSRFRDWISQEMDGQLAPEHVASLDDHLVSCADCRQYQEDLQLGSRMLQATEPELPDNFDWALQLQLSRALRDAAQQSHPWEESEPGWRRWLGRAGVSAAVGLAAVLTVAIMNPGSLLQSGSGDVAIGDPALRMPVQGSESLVDLGDATRRPLTMDLSGSGFGANLQRRVSSRETFGNAGIPGMNTTEVQRIRSLETENETMRRRLFAKDRQIQYLQAQLDSLTEHAVDRK